MQKVADERADIVKTSEVIREFTGRAPRGWLGPGLTETWETPDILAEEGYDYVCDWVLDDQPVMLRTRTRSLVSVPYTQECNDVAMMLIQHHTAKEYKDRAIDQFEQLYSDAEKSARIMALVAHPYIMGAPHRMRYFREGCRDNSRETRRGVLDRRANSRLVFGRYGPRCRQSGHSCFRFRDIQAVSHGIRTQSGLLASCDQRDGPPVVRIILPFSVVAHYCRRPHVIAGALARGLRSSKWLCNLSSTRMCLSQRRPGDTTLGIWN